MEIIAPRRAKGQPRGGINVYPFGIHIDGPTKGVSLTNRGGGGEERKRGTIEGFSAAARRRMREAMLTLEIKDSLFLGLTLTVPWKATDFEPLMDEFRATVHRFSVAFRRLFPHSGMIYRIELQQRGAPHLHALVYIAKADLAAPIPAPVAGVGAAEDAVAQFSMRELWSRAVLDLHHGSIFGFEQYGCKVEPIRDAGSMFRYLADHASKHKQAQLGYKGKQWGILGRANFTKREPVRLPAFVSPWHESRFLRLLRKVMRYRLQASRHPNWKRIPPFGSVLKGSRRACGDFYLRQDTALKMFRHALELSHKCSTWNN